MCDRCWGSIVDGATAGVLLSRSILEKNLKKEGYHLISEVEDSKKDTLFNSKWTKYKQETNKANTFSKSEEHKTISKEDFIKLCKFKRYLLQRKSN
ncbi:hypothetical protein A6V39_04135 [Candidatus Mycoplasma haematobovis]|uniref:Uncharacterized protein n=1 Tax=Candidatus Mycoplasma haematobovis TaxID=432608 RepID=A0A1A9QCW9_9MOLU|nr:hypothetical protein [Candidatus Mycoplasma haematobovis]OAL10078.1 hypothetical protein A6V39_04135 [Candidatus Mycoplasma haematobovis]